MSPTNKHSSDTPESEDPNVLWLFLSGWGLGYPPRVPGGRAAENLTKCLADTPCGIEPQPSSELTLPAHNPSPGSFPSPLSRLASRPRLPESKREVPHRKRLACFPALQSFADVAGSRSTHRWGSQSCHDVTRNQGRVSTSKGPKDGTQLVTDDKRPLPR
ncbi:hypothetical protein VTK26DRAFT_4838 [Humicola hyalothermophila]